MSRRMNNWEFKVCFHYMECIVENVRNGDIWIRVYFWEGRSIGQGDFLKQDLTEEMLCTGRSR